MGGPSVPVGHVRSGLLAVGHDAAYAHLLHFYERFRHNHRHVKGMGHPVRLHHLYHEPGSGHPWHDVPSLPSIIDVPGPGWAGGGHPWTLPMAPLILVHPPDHLYLASYTDPSSITISCFNPSNCCRRPIITYTLQ